MKEYWTIKNTMNGLHLEDESGGIYSVRKAHWLKWESRSLALLKMAQLQILSPSSKRLILVHHTVKTKPRGAKVGTWAWACEQMLAGKEVRMAGSGRKYAIANGLIASHLDPYGWHTLPGVFTHMLRGTEWQVVT